MVEWLPSDRNGKLADVGEVRKAKPARRMLLRTDLGTAARR
jgi:hypothetical protein